MDMDLTFKTDSGVFNYRVAAIIINNGRLLVMKNDLSPYYYLPGGRVNMHETAEEAIVREIKEELCTHSVIIRPLWFNQGFFVEDVTNEKFHELCIYFLVDIENIELIRNKNNFKTRQYKNNEIFSWLNLDCLEDEYIYPLFIKKAIKNLPNHIEFIVDKEY